MILEANGALHRPGENIDNVGNFLVGSEDDHKGRLIKTVYLNAMPVTRLNADENAETRQAAIQLFELGLCAPKPSLAKFAVSIETPSRPSSKQNSSWV